MLIYHRCIYIISMPEKKNKYYIHLYVFLTLFNILIHFRKHDISQIQKSFHKTRQSCVLRNVVGFFLLAI